MINPYLTNITKLLKNNDYMIGKRIRISYNIYTLIYYLLFCYIDIFYRYSDIFFFFFFRFFGLHWTNNKDTKVVNKGR